jgi:hypothetical protein
MTTARPILEPVLFSISRHTLFLSMMVDGKTNEPTSFAFAAFGHLEIAIAKKHLTAKRHPLNRAVTSQSGKGLLRDGRDLTFPLVELRRTSSI